MPRWPHDDTQSLIAFYGDPRDPGFENNLVLVKPPWPMTYEGKPIRGVRIHRKCADSLKAIFDEIAERVNHDWSRLPRGAVAFSGSYNFRPVRGSSRMSCHAFGAAIDMDAEHNPMNSRGDQGDMSDIVIDAFKRQGWYWGGDFRSRQDPMHFQAAHEGTPVALLDEQDDGAPLEPPMTDGHDYEQAFEPSYQPRRTASIEDQSPTPISNTLTMSAKSMMRSKIGWAQTILAFFGIGTVGSQVDASAFDKFKAFVFSPGFMLLVMAACIGLTIYWRWADHGRGAQR